MMKNFAFLKKTHALGMILRPYLWRLWLLGGLSVVQSLLQVGMALLFRGVIDAALAGSDRLWLWAVLLIGDLIAQIGTHSLQSWYAGSIVDFLTVRLRKKLLDTAVYCTDSSLEAFHSGQLLNRGMEDVQALCDGLVQAFPSLLGQVVRLAAAFGAVLLIYPAVAVVLLSAGVLVLAGVAVLRPVLKKRQRTAREAAEKVMSTMQEDLQQLSLIQSLQMQDPITQRFARQQKGSLRTRISLRRWSVGSNAIINTATMLGTGLLLLWGAGKVAANALSYGSLTSLIQLMNQFRSPVLGLSGLWTRFVSVEVSAERLEQLLQIPQHRSTSREVLSPLAVVFDNVTFRYTPEEDPVLENFNLRLPLTGWCSLTGFSGRGKSTLFKLILGLHTPQAGSVYLETPAGNIPCGPDTRYLFAYVPQDYAMFSGTVLENLQLVAPEAKEAQRRQALKLTCSEFVWETQAGEHTLLRENNTGLSKGQLQRLAIARALLMERPVLLLDECTSALDKETERAVLANLYSTGKNAILVTHRPSALKDLPGITQVNMEK